MTELYQRTAALSEAQRAVLAQKLDRLKGEKKTPLQQLVAYVVLHPGAAESDLWSVKAALKENLPSYMVPTAVLLPSLPRTANGKIDVQALPAPQLEKLSRSDVAAVPTTPVEARLLQVWQSVLGLRSIGINDNFFDLGGDSILSIQVVSQARAAGFNIVPNQLFEQPTIAELATALSFTVSAAELFEQPANRFSSLVPIQPEGTRRPFFFHGGSAEALTWTKFSRLLGPDQPFYAMQRPDFNAQSATDSTVEELAAICIREIRQIQPAGPYTVGGHCFGGTVAFEIARQLQAEGEKVNSLAVDAYCLSAGPRRALSWLQTKLQFGYFTLRKSYYYHGSYGQLTRLAKKVWRRSQRPAKSNLPANTASTGRTNLTETSVPETAISYQERSDRAHQASVAASGRYRPQHYSGSIKLFRAEVQITDWLYGKDLGWQSVIQGKVEIETIPGLFGNLFNQRSGPLLAERVKSYLDSLQQT